MLIETMPQIRTNVGYMRVVVVLCAYWCGTKHVIVGTSTINYGKGGVGEVANTHRDGGNSAADGGWF